MNKLNDCIYSYKYFFFILHYLLPLLSEWSKLCNVESPFEFRALEVALEAICSFLAARTTELEMAAYPALDELTSKVHILFNSFSSCLLFNLGSPGPYRITQANKL